MMATDHQSLTYFKIYKDMLKSQFDGQNNVTISK